MCEGKYILQLTFWPQLFEGWITLFTREIAIQLINVNKTNHAICWIVIYIRWIALSTF